MPCWLLLAGGSEQNGRLLVSTMVAINIQKIKASLLELPNRGCPFSICGSLLFDHDLVGNCYFNERICMDDKTGISKALVGN